MTRDLSMYSHENGKRTIYAARSNMAYRGAQRRAYALKLRESGMNYDEIAEVLGTTNLACRLLVHKLRKRLKEQDV